MALRTAVVFPGQGTVGAEISEEVRGAMGPQFGHETPYQLSVLAGSVSTLHALRGRGVTADVVAGHSLGEYSAAYAAGALALPDAVRLVAERDRLMNEASGERPGGMVALLGSDPRQVVEAVESFPQQRGVVVAANFNTPRQTVISGEKGALEEVSGGVKGRGRKLEVAGAFHSPLMLEASLAMSELLESVELRDPEVPMISGVDGAVLAQADDVRLALKDQMLSPVRWVAVVERMAQLGVAEMVETGEGTLVRMLRDFKDVEIRGRSATEILS